MDICTWIYIYKYTSPATDEILLYAAWLRWKMSVDVAMVILNYANDMAVLFGVAVNILLCCYHVHVNLVLVFPGCVLLMPVKSFSSTASAEV